MTMCITVCSQMIFPQTAFAATKAAVEKAGEAFVAGMTETAEAEEVLSEEELRQQIVDFALQFEGNPYVYGGTSLTNGADCSGFVMSVFAQFGYSLPRVAADQYNQSAKKSVEDLEPVVIEVITEWCRSLYNKAHEKEKKGIISLFLEKVQK